MGNKWFDIETIKKGFSLALGFWLFGLMIGLIVIPIWLAITFSALWLLLYLIFIIVTIGFLFKEQ